MSPGPRMTPLPAIRRRTRKESPATSRGMVSSPRSTPLLSTDAAQQTQIQTQTQTQTQGEAGVFPLAVAPEKIVFPDIEASTLYVFNVVLQNTSSRAHQVRVLPPASAKFRFANNEAASFSLAPGLSHAFDLEFFTDDGEFVVDVYDAIRVLTADAEASIPVEALTPRPNVTFADPRVDLGSVPPGAPAQRMITLVNGGSLDGPFQVAEIASSESVVEIVPAAGKVPAHGSLDIKVVFKSSSTGPFRTVVPFEFRRPSGVPLIRSLDLSAMVVKQALTLFTQDRAAALDVVQFKPLYFGQKVTLVGVLANTGPTTLSFAVMYGKERGGATSVMTTASDLARQGPRAGLTDTQQDAERTIMTVTPSRGTIASGESITMSFTFAPRAPPAPAKGDLEAKLDMAGASSPRGGASPTSKLPPPTSLYFKAPYFIEMVETGSKTKVTLKGEAHEPGVVFSQSSFLFGECPLNSFLDMAFMVKNRSSVLPADVVFGPLAHFAVSCPKVSLLPLQSKSLVLRFAPKQYGDFAGSLRVTTCGGTQSLSLSVSGLCTTSAVLPPGVPKGHKGSALSFAPTDLHLVHPDDHARAANRRKAAAKRAGPRRSRHAPPPPSDLVDKRFSYAPETAARLQVAKKKYSDYLRDSAAARVAATKARDRRRSVDFLNGVDLGMVPGSGLEEPTLALPPAREKLYLEHLPGESSSDTYLKALKLHSGDEFIATKFPAVASGPAQKKETASVLSTSELQDILRGPNFIDFGSVSVFSDNAKSFNVSNHLDQAIHVAVFTDECEELAGSFPEGQVIPPGATAGFDIHYASMVPQKFNRMVQYMINGHHTYSFSVKGESIATRLFLSRSFLEFHFPPDIVEPRVTEVVTINNPGNAGAEFKWSPVNAIESSAPVFDIVPLTGIVPPDGSLNCHITYTPKALPEDICEFKLSVKGGAELSLTCKGAIGVGKASFSSGALDLGVVSVGMVSDASVYLVNVGKADVFFSLNSLASAGESFGDLMVTSPMTGRIPVGARTRIGVSFAPTQPQDLRTSLKAAILGGGVVELPLSASAEVPSLSIEQPEFDFGQVYIGASNSIPLTLANTGRIPASCYLDLSEQLEFAIDIPTEYLNELDETGEAPIMMVADIAGPASSAFDGETLANTIGTAASNIYKLTLEPGSVLELQLVFTPSEAFEVAFELPLRMVSIEDAGDLRRIVSATAIRTPLAVSDPVVDFGDVVILKPGALPYTHTLVLTNDDMRGFGWKFEMSHPLITDGTLKFEPLEGHLNPSQRASVRISFFPLATQNYSITLPILIDGETGGRSITVGVRGRGVYPNLTFFPPAIELPVVPLGFTSRAALAITGQGYDMLTLQYEVPLDARALPLTVEFPGSHEVTRDEPTVHVEVTFSSKTPLAFATTIDFVDHQGARFSVPVKGLADNTLPTLAPFLALSRTEFAFVEAEAEPEPESRSARSARGSRPNSRASAADGSDSGPAPRGKTVRLRTATMHDRQMLNDRIALLPNMGGLGRSHDAPSGLLVPSGSGGVSFRLDSRASSRSAGASMSPLPRSAALVHPGLEYVLRDAAEVLGAWLSARAAPLPIRNFPEDVIRDNGVPFVAAFTALSGRRVPGRVGKKVPKNKLEFAQKLFGQYGSLLRVLRSCGGLLTQVEPEDFLSLAECDRIRTARLKAANPDIDQDEVYAHRDELERTYGHRSLMAWTLTALQTVRAFVLPRVTLESFVSRVVQLQAPPKSLTYLDDLTAEQAAEFGVPGLQGSNSKAGRGGGRGGSGSRSDGRRGPPQRRRRRRRDVAGDERPRPVPIEDREVNGVTFGTVLNSRKLTVASLDGSNVYSRSELLLLEWATVCYELVYPTSARQLVNFDIDFADGTVLAALLLAYIPQLGDSWLSTVYQEAAATHHVEANAKRVVNAMRDAGIDYPLEEDEITSPDPLNMLLLVVHLYDVLPAFRPVAALRMSGALHEEITKSVVLRNPSSTSPIIYNVWLTGSNDFFVKQSALRLEPDETAELPVYFESRFSSPRQATLTLVAKRVGSLQTSVLAFRLESDINDLKPLQVLFVSSRAYEQSSLKIKFENPSPFNAQFAIKLTQGRVLPLADATTPTSATAGGRGGRGRGGRGRDAPAPSHPSGLDVDAYLDEIDVVRSDADGSVAGHSGDGRGGGHGGRVFRDLDDLLGRPADAFWCRLAAELSGVGVLELGPSESVTIPVTFLPFFEGEYWCRLQFVDERAGEFVYEVRGRGMLPEPIETRRWTTQVRTPLTKMFVVPDKNPGLEKAKGVMLDRLRLVGADMGQLREVAQAMRAPLPRRVYSVSYVVPGTKGGDRILSGPDVVTVDSSGGAGGDAEGVESVGLDSALNLTYSPGEQGVVRARLLLRSAFDVRVYDFEGTATAPPERATLELAAPVRTSVTQPIPVVNHNTEAPMTVRAQLQGNVFRGAPSLTVGPGETSDYELTFTPAREGEHTSELVLTNTETSLSSIYALVGVGEPPLAEEHRVVEVRARQSTKVTFPVDNTGSRTSGVVLVHTDVPNASGPPSLRIEGGQATSYELTVAPTRMGTTLGQITFTYPSGTYMWYTVEVKATQPEYEGRLEGSAPLRSRTTLRAKLRNPLSEPATFSVKFKGHGLSGPAEFRVDAGGEGEYALAFLPLREGEHEGELVFSHRELGDYSYVVALTGTAPEPIELERFKCEVGKVARVQVELRCPLRVGVPLMVSNSNPHNFRVVPEAVTLSPLAPTPVTIEYIPSAIGVDQRGTIKLSHAETGAWTYQAVGVGTPPTKMDVVTVTERVRFQNHAQLNFVNPFEHELTVNVKLVTPEDIAEAKAAAEAAAAAAAAAEAEKEQNLRMRGSGTLSTMRPMLRSQAASRTGSTMSVRAKTSATRLASRLSMLDGDAKVPGDGDGGDEAGPSGARRAERAFVLPQPGQFTLPGFGVLRIPYTFGPSAMQTYDADLIVEAEAAAGGEPIEWVYPLRGIAEAPVASEVYTLAVRSREKKDEILDFYATGLASFEGLESFRHQLNVPVEYEAAVRSSLVVTPVVNTLRQATEPLRFRFEFEPSLPFETDVQFLLHKRTGGLWRYTLHLQADEPNVDDVFEMDAVLHKTTAIAFRQSNHSANEAAPFRAFFTPQSSFDFSVEPSEGELPPAGDEDEDGTRLVVYCSPSSYGRIQRGWLVIQTPEYQWTYEIKATPPEYVPPSGSRRRVPLDNKLSAEVQAKRSAKHGAKNFLRSNVSSLRRMQEQAPRSGLSRRRQLQR